MATTSIIGNSRLTTLFGAHTAGTVVVKVPQPVVAVTVMVPSSLP